MSGDDDGSQRASANAGARFSSAALTVIAGVRTLLYSDHSPLYPGAASTDASVLSLTLGTAHAMLVIRLTRVGKKKQPSYRMVVQEKSQDPWGDYRELVGHYNPLVHPAALTLKEDRIAHWLSKGAQPSDTVWNLLVDRGLVQGAKRRIVHISRKKRAKLEGAKAGAPAAA